MCVCVCLGVFLVLGKGRVGWFFSMFLICPLLLLLSVLQVFNQADFRGGRGLSSGHVAVPAVDGALREEFPHTI